MSKAFGIFWIIFILYFIFAHPAIIYYNTGFEQTDLSKVNPTMALWYLGISFFLWTVVFSLLLWLIIKYSFIAQRNIRYIQREGDRLKAAIIAIKPLKGMGSKREAKSLQLQLENLESETITHTVSFTDSKPEEDRYQVGKTIYLRVDREFRRAPYVVLEESFSKINWLLFILLGAFLIAVIYYFQFSYSLESAGYGWRFLTFWHPLIVIPGCLLFFPGIIFVFLKFLIFKKMNIGKEALALKFKGRKAMASVQDAVQTGTQINDQPEVRFTLKYTDSKGQTIVATVNKIVSLMDIASVKSDRDRAIFYDPQNPYRVAFVEDLAATR